MTLLSKRIRWVGLSTFIAAASTFAGDQAAIEQCKKDLKDFQKDCVAQCKLKKRANCEASCSGTAKMMEKECNNATNDEDQKK